jgi:hypothetical protein
MRIVLESSRNVILVFRRVAVLRLVMCRRDITGPSSGFSIGCCCRGMAGAAAAGAVAGCRSRRQGGRAFLWRGAGLSTVTGLAAAMQCRDCRGHGKVGDGASRCAVLWCFSPSRHVHGISAPRRPGGSEGRGGWCLVGGVDERVVVEPGSVRAVGAGTGASTKSIAMRSRRATTCSWRSQGPKSFPRPCRGPAAVHCAGTCPVGCRPYCRMSMAATG